MRWAVVILIGLLVLLAGDLWLFAGHHLMTICVWLDKMADLIGLGNYAPKRTLISLSFAELV